MNKNVYVFVTGEGVHTQYPDDYTRNLFASYQKLSQQDMLAIRRKDAIIYYSYLYKIEEGYVGISLVFNGVFCTDVKALFAFFRKTISDLADKGEWITWKNDKIVLMSMEVDILFKTCKELDDNLSGPIADFTFQTLPPIHVGMNPLAWKIYSQDEITNDTISESLTRYNRIYIVGDKIVNTQQIQVMGTNVNAPIRPLRTDRGLAKRFFLGLITLGIYSIIVEQHIGEELNLIASKHDGRKTMDFCLIYFIFSWLTLGIAGYVWFHRTSDRMRGELQRRKIDYKFGARDYWLWGVLGAFIIVGPFVYTYKRMKAMNLINADYNQKG